MIPVCVGGVTVDCVIADTPVVRSVGLLTRDKLNKTEGMLFMFDHPQKLISMTTEGMRFPIDIVFFNEQMRVIKIEDVCNPGMHYINGENAKYVIELPAGFCREHMIEVGDELVY